MLVPPNATIEAGARERRAVPRWDSTGPGHRGLPRIGVNNEQSPSSCILNNMSMARSLGQLGAGLRGAGLRVTDLAGMEMGFSGAWRITRDTGVNYLMMAEKPG